MDLGLELSCQVFKSSWSSYKPGNICKDLVADPASTSGRFFHIIRVVSKHEVISSDSCMLHETASLAYSRAGIVLRMVI